MKFNKFSLLIFFVIAYSLPLKAFYRKPSKTVYEDVLREENGKLVRDIAIKTGDYKPNPQLTINIQEPSPRLSQDSPRKSVCKKFPLKFDMFFENFLYLLSDPGIVGELEENFRRHLPNNTLLCGEIKDDALYLAQLIHEEFQLPFVHVHGYQFLGNYRGEGARKVGKALATRDPQGRPLLLFIDDFDPIAAIPPVYTSYNAEHEWRLSKSGFRCDFDKLERDPSIILMVSTKDIYNLDEGIRQRFGSSVVNIKPMTQQEREQLLTVCCKDLNIEDKEKTIKKMAWAAQGLSRKKLTETIHEAAQLLPTPKDESYHEILTQKELLNLINKARDEEGISWSAYFKRMREIINI